MTPIDLRAIAGKRFRLEYDPAHRGKKDDPWLLTIPCQRGHIYPHSDKLLGVATNGRGPTAKALRSLAGVTVLQDGDDGINAVFAVGLLANVVKLVKPRRKRQVSDAERQRLSELSAKHGYKRITQDAGEGLETPQSTLADSSAA